MAEEVGKLKQRRTRVKAQQTSFKKYLIEQFPVSKDIIQLRLRLKKFEELWTTFDTIQSELEILDPDTEGEFGKREEIENIFYELITQAQRLLEESTPPTSNASGSQVSSNSENGTNITNTKLPKINLPEFNGSFEKWLSFKDAFTSLIHNNKSLDSVQKLQYLRSCLVGEAAQAIESFETTANNYENAWSLITELYNNTRVIILRHLTLLFKLPAMQRESPHSLRQLINGVQQHLRALKSLDQPTEHWDAIIVHLLTQRLDKATLNEWNHSLTDTDMPSLKTMITFLTRVSQDSGNSVVSETLSSNKSQSNVDNRRQRHNRSFLSAQISCPICTGSHNIQKCPTFMNLNIQERITTAKGASLCLNCLRRNHSTSQCKSRGCQKCNRRHNTLLHINNNNASSPITETTNISTQEGTSTSTPGTSNQTTLTNTITAVPSEVLLSTAIIYIIDQQGSQHRCRALLDSASQSNFITLHLANRLGLKKTEVATPIAGLNNIITNTKYLITATIKSRDNAFSSKLQFLTVPQITGLLPARQVARQTLQIPKNIVLADPEFHKPAEIDILIGAGLFFSLLCAGQFKVTTGNSTSRDPSPILQKTRLGWIISGEFPQTMTHKTSYAFFTNTCLDDGRKQELSTLADQMNKFWNVEEKSQIQLHLSDDEKLCENHFQSNVSRDAQGRYIVKLPFNNRQSQLGDSYNMAKRRLEGIERKLNLQPRLQEEYHKFLNEYQELGHMTEVSTEALDNGYYLPHHPVIKESSTTTKIRVVFDGSAKTTTGISLNDTLMIGPTIQNDLFSITLRFRTYNYVLSADIEKMYRQVLVHPDDRRYQRILWRKGPEDSIKTYELNTVTYGLAAAPYLAIRCLHQLAEDERDNFPEAATILQRDFYVDDLLTGANTFEEAMILRDQLIELLSTGGFHLRQWCSNEQTLFHGLEKGTLNRQLQLDKDSTIKTLGIHWNSSSDSIIYTVSAPSNSAKITKRIMLSEIAKLFDPLGLLGPVIVEAKVMMQQLWQHKLHWDESVPLDIHTSWMEYKRQLTSLNNLTLPRKVIASNFQTLQLHGFCDASERAYGACIYLRSTEPNGNNTSRLICSKSRVAPLKTITIPRLELCAAQLLVNLYNTVINSLNLNISKAIFWTDSMITLHWINTSPRNLKTFVANRIAEIQNITSPSQWRHVPSTTNPADSLSRGQLPHDFLNNDSWYNGPSWLNEDETLWPKTSISFSTNVPEQRSTTCLANTTSDFMDNLLKRYSSLTKLKRVIAYCLRVKRSNRAEAKTTHLTNNELDNAMNVIIINTQQQGFKDDIYHLKRHGSLSNTSKLRSLNPFLDTKGILRVGGRLQHANIPLAQQHPILLPRSHHVTKLIMQFEHLKNYHAGIQGTLYAIRRTYWPIDGRNQIRRIIHECKNCSRLTPCNFQYIMGNLPSERVTISRPFINVGIDYCGPFYIKEKRHRNRNRIKVYVAVFICLATKAVHLETVSDLSTEAFLAALRRFVARRGKCLTIHSDNATNFIGAKGEYEEIMKLLNSKEHKDKVIQFSTNEGIEWKFIPPRAPHFGGLWEAAVRSFKHHMKRTIGDALFTYEDLNTYVIEIEAILNSRPLTPLSSDPNDPIALTPGHFLIGDSLTSLPEEGLLTTISNRLSSWKHIQKLKQHFWSRWYKEYINELTVRNKWHSGTANIQKDTVVLLKEDNVPPLQWPLGRIIDVHPGDDGIIRVVTVKTTRGTYKRSVKKLAPLYHDEHPNQQST